MNDNEDEYTGTSNGGNVATGIYHVSNTFSCPIIQLGLHHVCVILSHRRDVSCLCDTLLHNVSRLRDTFTET